MDDVTQPEVRHSTCFQCVFVQFRALQLGQTTLMQLIDFLMLSKAGLNNIDQIARCQARLAGKFAGVTLHMQLILQWSSQPMS